MFFFTTTKQKKENNKIFKIHHDILVSGIVNFSRSFLFYKK
jgi:hypothetical protein